MSWTHYNDGNCYEKPKPLEIVRMEDDITNSNTAKGTILVVAVVEVKD